MSRAVPDKIACAHCGEYKVPGGALASHQQACAKGGPKKRKRTRYRELFFAINGIGPYNCYFNCGRSVSFEEVIVHHIDDDFTNDSADNLSAAHRSCHNGHHFAELWSERREEFSSSDTRGHRVPHTEEAKAKMSAAVKAAWARRKAISD